MAITSAEILKAARRTAHLTQSELAVRAHITQSVISAYESGRREPALSTLMKLVEAAGCDMNIGLELRVVPIPDFLGLLHRNKNKIMNLCRNAGVSNMRIFGSVARGTATKDSDIDLVVDISSDMGLLGLM
ncbi:MAG: helix-turn-helix domain-containing protein, partial [Aurantimicrobium sp.]